MRYAWVALLVLMSAGLAHAQINPQTQIAWPVPCMTNPGTVYNAQTNNCFVPSGGPGGGLPVNNPAYTGTISGPSTNFASMIAQQAQFELYGPSYASPAAAAAAACATNAPHAVWFPFGNYAVTVPVYACDNLSLRGIRGTRFMVSGPIWGFANQNANLTSGSNGIHHVWVQGITWDITSTPTTTLGAWDIKGISWSNFIGNVVWANNNTAPAVTEDGGNFNFNGGDYGNNFFGNIIYNSSSAFPWLSSGPGILIQNGSNENRHWGLQVNRFSTNILIDSGNDNIFSGVDAENWGQSCLTMHANAARNKVAIRCESDFNPWTANTAYQVGNFFVDSNGNLEQVTTAGTSGSTPPTWNAPNVAAILDYSTGCNVVGNIGQTVLLTSFNNGSTATATGTLITANTLAGATWVITSPGTGATAAPTSATCSAGTVSSASGTATITTSVGTLGNTTTDNGAVETVIVVSPADVMASYSNSNAVDVYVSGYERGLVDSTGENSYAPMVAGLTANGTGNNISTISNNTGTVQIGFNKKPQCPNSGCLDLHGFFQFDNQMTTFLPSLATSSFQWKGQSVRTGAVGTFPWFTYTSTNGGTDLMTLGTLGDFSVTNGGGTSYMKYNSTTFNWQVFNNFDPMTAGAGQVGTALLPFASVAVGNAANRSQVMNCAACTAARSFTLPDGNTTTALVASLTTTSATSDNVTMQGMTASGHCSPPAPTNASAQAATIPYVSAKAANQITVTHAATSGMTYDLICTAN